MLSKTKKLLFLTTGLAGALVVSSVAGVALSACTVEAVNGGSSSDSITLPDTWYSKDINWTDATSLNNLIIDKQGFVYSNKYMTEIIAILPGYESSDLVIPSTVTSITGYNNVTTSTDSEGNTTTTKTATGAFEGIDSITNVKFAGSKITTIGARAFASCTSLQSVTLPSSVTLIDTYAFSGCSVLNTINLSNIQYIGISAFANAMSDVPSGSISLDLNKTVFIGASAFSNATGIASVDFSKNTVLTRIAEAAFSGCTELSSDIDLSNATKLVTLGSSSTPATLGSTFANTAITNLYLPSTAGLKTIAASTFSGCTNLVNVGPKGTTGFKATESVSGIYNQAFAGTKIASVDISLANSSTPLQAGAFSGMTELTSVSLGTTITTIPAACFSNCTSLTTLTLPSSITSISGGTSTFTSVTVSSGNVTATPNISFGSEVNYPAFYGSGLTTIDLSNVTSYQTTSGSTLSLPNTLFYNCPSLTTVTLKEGTTAIGSGSFARTPLLTTINTGSTTSSGYVATSDITSVGSYAFWRSGIPSVDISAITSSSYTSLPQVIFTECPNLTSIKFPSTITTIPAYAVVSTPNLTTVNFENLALTSIGSYNFYNCNLTEVNLSSAKITNFSTSTPYLFSGLSKDTIVKLSSTVWNVSSDTTFTYNETTTDSSGNETTTAVALNIAFPNGFAPTSTSNFTNGNLVDHTMFSRISDSLDMSSFTALRSIGKRTFFGGPVSGLVFNASQFASGLFGDYYSSTSSSWSYLGFLGSGVTANTNTSANPETYLAANLPFGSMANLESIAFSNFSSRTTTDSSLMAKTTSETWSQVARIISSFAKSTSEENTASPVANLSTWTDENITASIDYDTEDSEKITSVDLKNNSNQTLLTISDTNNSGSFTYSGITWTVAVDSNNSTITITSSTDVDTYKLAVAKSSGSGYDTFKAFFNTKSETTETDGTSSTTTILPDSSITITLNIVTA